MDCSGPTLTLLPARLATSPTPIKCFLSPLQITVLRPYPSYPMLYRFLTGRLKENKTKLFRLKNNPNFDLDLLVEKKSGGELCEVLYNKTRLDHYIYVLNIKKC